MNKTSPASSLTGDALPPQSEKGLVPGERRDVIPHRMLGSCRLEPGQRPHPAPSNQAGMGKDLLKLRDRGSSLACLQVGQTSKVNGVQWLGGLGVGQIDSSARLYWESKLAFFAPKNVPLPAAVSAFPEELYQAPRSWTERAYPKLIFYNRHDKGGHFAAWEQPDLLVLDLRAAFKSLR